MPIPDTPDEKQFATASKILLDDNTSAASKYRQLTAGNTSFLFFLLYELVSFLLVAMPGALGLWLRRKLLAPFFGSCGTGVVIGKHCALRHPRKLFIGDHVVIDDFCVLDARGTGNDGLRIGDRSIINRGTQLVSKGGDIAIGAGCALGSRSNMVSWSGIRIDDDVSIAAECLVSAGTYAIDQMSLPRSERKAVTNGPIRICSHAWIASRVTILDAVCIGEDSVVSAGAVVRSNVPPRSLAHGNPAQVVFTMRE